MAETIHSIQKLSQEVIGQIAAGEVVERPASAIKELVENSIDAGATAITIEIKEGGIPYLRVSDNGRGIPPSQVRIAFERHATSKITRPEDLFDVHTLGFRGEALASIAAVSKVTMTTRAAGEDFGVKVQVEAGEIQDVREAATPAGTTVLVRDLFFNTPVRLKFLKKPSLEASMVSDYIMRLILSRPNISFRFVNQGKTVYHSVGDGTLESALYTAFGKDALSQMKKVSGAAAGLAMDGFVGVGALSRGNRQLQSFFINGRYFRDAALSKALENACQGLVMSGRFPCCSLYLRLPFQHVDVNVHPNKLEVRFQNLPAIAQAVEEMVREVLRPENFAQRFQETNDGSQENAMKAEGGFQLVPLASGEITAPGEQDTQIGQEIIEENGLQAADENIQAVKQNDTTRLDILKELKKLKPVIVPTPVPQASMRLDEGAASYAIGKVMIQKPPTLPSTSQPEPAQETLLTPESAAVLPRLVGVAFQTYWIFEAGDKLLLVDQHAAHERLLFDKLWELYEAGNASQPLLTPQLVQLTAQECALVEELQPVFMEAGFDVEPFDSTSVAVRAIPTILGRNESARDLLLEALEEASLFRGAVTRERLRKQVMQLACKKAIKAGDRLSENEIAHLVEDMMATGVMPTCPHGRPIVVEMKRRDFDKLFGRIP